MMRRLSFLLLPLLAAVPAAAQEGGGETFAAAPVAVESTPDFVFEFGIGGEIAPAYEGSDEYIVSPFPIISVEYLDVPGVVSVGGGETLGGISIGPSFRFIGERTAEDNEELEGLFDIGATYEVGARLSYEFASSDFYATEVYGAARYAFGGAEGVVGEFGANAVLRPSTVFELKAGPVVTLASEDYMDTYFSVSPFEAIASDGRFGAYEADGGFKSVGAKVETRYEFRPDLFLTANVEYQRLVGDAENSPVVVVGDENQYFFGLGLSKRFSLDLF